MAEKHPQIIDEADFLFEGAEQSVNESRALSEIGRADLDQRIVTAHRYPRTLSRVMQNILSTVTLDTESAEECMYAFVRGGKAIQGPSIRFAEAVKAYMGNNHGGARIDRIDRENKLIVCVGGYLDLETNAYTEKEVQRSIATSAGALYSADMINVTANATCSIAFRNAILAGVPKPVWRRAYQMVKETIAGDITTLAATRVKAIEALAHFGIAPDQIYPALGVGGVEDIVLDHIPTLRGMFTALKSGEATVEEMFPPKKTPVASVKERLRQSKEGGIKAPTAEGFSHRNAPVDDKANTPEGSPPPGGESQRQDTPSDEQASGGGDTAAPDKASPAEDFVSPFQGDLIGEEPTTDKKPPPRMTMSASGSVFEDHQEFLDAATAAFESSRRTWTAQEIDDQWTAWALDIDRLKKNDARGYSNLLMLRNQLKQAAGR